MDEVILWSLARLILVLFLVVPATYFVTRWYGKRHIPNQDLKVRATLPLGTNKTLYVVEWEQHRLLLGVTNQTITVLERQPKIHNTNSGEVRG